MGDVSGRQRLSFQDEQVQTELSGGEPGPVYGVLDQRVESLLQEPQVVEHSTERRRVVGVGPLRNPIAFDAVCAHGQVGENVHGAAEFAHRRPDRLDVDHHRQPLEQGVVRLDRLAGDVLTRLAQRDEHAAPVGLVRGPHDVTPALQTLDGGRHGVRPHPRLVGDVSGRHRLLLQDEQVKTELDR